MRPVRFVCDATALKGPWGAQAEDVLVIGGFVIEECRVQPLLDAVRCKKNEIVGHPDVPVKWNLKDLKQALGSYQLSHLEAELKKKANPLRAGLLSNLIETEPILFASIFCCFGSTKKAIVATKPTLTSFSFLNLLQRLGLWAKDSQPDSVRITLDWPEGSDRGPFEAEYLDAWRPDGVSAQETNFCGPLQNLRFEPGLTFGVTALDPLLQLCDLTVGATRSFIGYALTNGVKDFGVQQFAALLPRFHRSAGGKVVSYGLAISPATPQLKSKLNAGLANLQA